MEERDDQHLIVQAEENMTISIFPPMHKRMRCEFFVEANQKAHSQQPKMDFQTTVQFYFQMVETSSMEYAYLF